MAFGQMKVKSQFIHIDWKEASKAVDNAEVQEWIKKSGIRFWFLHIVFQGINGYWMNSFCFSWIYFDWKHLFLDTINRFRLVIDAHGEHSASAERYEPLKNYWAIPNVAYLDLDKIEAVSISAIFKSNFAEIEGESGAVPPSSPYRSAK